MRRHWQPRQTSVDIEGLSSNEHEESYNKLARRTGRLALARNTVGTAIATGAASLVAETIAEFSIPSTGDAGKDFAVGAITGALIVLATAGGTAQGRHNAYGPTEPVSTLPPEIDALPPTIDLRTSGAQQQL